MFCALVNGLINAEGLQFDPVIEDVKSLNQKALNNQLDVTKLSMNAYAHVSNNYLILDSGSALGKNCGPILISKKKRSIEEIPQLKIAIPGKYTTANLLLSIFFPAAQNKMEMIFSDIENAVLSESVDAGLIIHENRFTYQQKRLLKIADMGELWEQHTSCLLPLGCIAVKRNIELDVAKKINHIVNKSIQFALDNPEKVMPYVRKHAQEMDELVMKQHINLYVNEFSLALGDSGKKVIELLLYKGKEAGLLPEIQNQIFIS